MKRCLCLALSILLLMTLGACVRQSEPPPVTEAPPVTESPSAVPQIETTQPQSANESPAEPKSREDGNGMTSITITVGGSVFHAKLCDNGTATAFLERFPMTFRHVLRQHGILPRISMLADMGHDAFAVRKDLHHCAGKPRIHLFLM